MVSLIQNVPQPKLENEIGHQRCLPGLWLIFIMVIGTLLFFVVFLDMKQYLSTLDSSVGCIEFPTTIGGLLPTIGVAGITRS